MTLADYINAFLARGYRQMSVIRSGRYWRVRARSGDTTYIASAETLQEAMELLVEEWDTREIQ